MEAWGKRVVLTAVFLVWLLNFFAAIDSPWNPLFVPGYESKESINALFALMVGWRFARRGHDEDADT